MSYDENPFISPEDWEFIELAEQVKKRSNDPKRKVGCVFAREGRLVSTGYNRLPKRILESPSRLLDQGFKDKVILHAELSALLNAGISSPLKSHYDAYVTYHPCSRCASLLIESGVKKVFCPKPRLHSAKWGKDFQTASDILTEANVTTLYYSEADGI